ncbi:MAG: polysulfide reductase NrfD [Anaerolineales bacterium]|nr:polysulfide reductase NrfD [Anaerolineales bacterium]MCX7608165.1 polysulfide reductase NrfD [Anaerolineales bacterium]MDW8226199.1 NrfD/PsrC family molybdoenzyme membrane anchor subunit [Anaerolineales bacterium]
MSEQKTLYSPSSSVAHSGDDELEHLRREHLMLDPRPRGEMNAMVMEAMLTTSWKFKLVFAFMALVVIVCLFGVWGYLIAEGIGVAGLTNPVYWGIFLVNTVFWIGISHAGTFVSALLRVFKAEFRRPFTRAAELLTTFGLVQAGLSIFFHMGRVWVSYWLFPYPNERQLWPNFHSALSWDFLAINTYLLASTMYLFLPLIPDLAMARDRSTGWRKVFYRILSLGFRGTEGEWTHLRIAMNIFAFAILPVMFSVHTIVSWDFATAMRPGWNSTIFGPYFVIGALQSGLAAVAMVLVIVRSTMKHMTYFIREEVFDALGKLMLVISMAWAYFFFNDYMVQWYGGDQFTEKLLHFHEAGPLGWMWFAMLIFNVAIPWLTLWNRKIRRNPWALFAIGLGVNVAMWLERYIIIPLSLTINFMPFTWRMYVPGVEVPLGIGTLAFFILLYMAASKLIPLVPVWEVQEGQLAHTVRRVGKEVVVSVAEME